MVFREQRFHVHLWPANQNAPGRSTMRLPEALLPRNPTWVETWLASQRAPEAQTPKTAAETAGGNAGENRGAGGSAGSSAGETAGGTAGRLLLVCSSRQGQSPSSPPSSPPRSHRAFSPSTTPCTPSSTPIFPAVPPAVSAAALGNWASGVPLAGQPGLNTRESSHFWGLTILMFKLFLKLSPLLLFRWCLCLGVQVVMSPSPLCRWTRVAPPKMPLSHDSCSFRTHRLHRGVCNGISSLGICVFGTVRGVDFVKLHVLTMISLQCCSAPPFDAWQ